VRFVKQYDILAVPDTTEIVVAGEKPGHRARRERMPAEGMLLQIDGSPFRWLGPTGPRWCLLAALDDATSDPVGAIFHAEEDAAGYMEILRHVVVRKGTRPQSTEIGI
jgi:hypothetical protein